MPRGYGRNNCPGGICPGGKITVFLFLCQHVGLNKPPENHLYEIGLVDQYSIDIVMVSCEEL